MQIVERMKWKIISSVIVEMIFFFYILAAIIDGRAKTTS